MQRTTGEARMMTLAMGVLVCLGAGAHGADAGTLYTYELSRVHSLNLSEPRQVRRLYDECHVVASLQGVVNRRAPRLYLYFTGHDGATDRFWLQKFQEPGGWLAKKRLEPLANVDALLARFRSDIEGVVVYDERVPATSNVASTIAGVENLVCVRWDSAPDSMFAHLTSDPAGPRLPVKRWLVNPDGTPLFTGRGTLPGSQTPSSGSAKCDAYLWAKEQYLDTGRCDARWLGYYLDAYWIQHPAPGALNHTLTNHDFLVARRGFVFDLGVFDDDPPVDEPGQPLGADVRTLNAILASAHRQLRGREMTHVAGFVPWDSKYTTASGGKHEPVPCEWRYAEILSCYNALMDADAPGMQAMANASVFQHYPLKRRYPQTRPSEASLAERGFVSKNGRVAPRHYVTLYAGDYDAAAWVYQTMPATWADAARGTVPVGWAINPVLAERFAAGLAYLRETATAQDFFVAGDSGAGYINPGHLVPPRAFSGLPSGLDTWTRFCTRYYRQWDLSITGFIIDGFAPAMTDEILAAYARFSRDGIVAQKIGQRGIAHGMPFVRMNLDLYKPIPDAARNALSALGNETPDFQIFRTILWKPSELKQLKDAIEAGRPDVSVVDPFTFFMLLTKAESEGTLRRD